MRCARRGLTRKARSAANRLAQSNVIHHEKFRIAEKVALYRAFDGEVDTETIAQTATEQGKQVLYARTGPEARLSFVEPRRWETLPNGCPNPAGPIGCLADRDLLVVPGLGFDDDGYRIGFGYGYYDRYLAQTKAWPLGLAFECQRITQLPREPWDLPVASLVTEVGVYDFNSQETQTWTPTT